MKVRITRLARREAKAARFAFEHRDPATVNRFRDRLNEATRQLGRFPQSGHLADDGTRRLLLSPFPYSLWYMVQANVVVVVAVVHAAEARSRSGDE